MDTSESASFSNKKQNVSITTTSRRVRSVNAEKRTAFKRQLLATSSAVIGSICFGMSTGFTGTLLHQIKHLIDTATGSWLAGSVVLSMPVGVLLGGISMRQFGRRLSLIFSSVPWLLGWPCLSTAPDGDVQRMTIGCSLIGLSAGIFSSVSTVYVTEVCAPRERNLVTVAISVGVASGILLSHVLGIALFWRTALGWSVLVPAIAFALAFFSPETPNWLILKGRADKAKANFIELRGVAEEAEIELNVLLGKRTENVARNRRGVFTNMLSGDFLRALVILCFLFGVQQGSGLNVVAFYAVGILQRMSGSSEEVPATATILIDTVRVFSCLISFYCVKAMSRRSLFFCSAAATFVALVVIVIALLYQLPDAVVIVAMCSYIASVYVGILPVPWIMSAELYPAVLRDLGTSITTIYSFLAVFLIVKTSPLLLDRYGAPFTFGMYAFLVLCGSVILYFIMPETKGNTLQQIEDTIANRR